MCLVLLGVQARGCNLNSAMSGLNLFDWTYTDNGIQDNLRVLDLGENPDLTDAAIGGAMASLPLWEL